MKSEVLLLEFALAACVVACQEPRGPGAAPLEQGGPPSPEEISELATLYPIVFCSTRDGAARGLFVLSADATSWRRLTRRGNFFWPRWAPDGKRIVFRQGVEDLSADVGVALTSGELASLTDGEPWQDVIRTANWSFDGSEIAFASRGNGLAADLRLWTLAPSGGERERLVPAHEGSQGEATWSPDGAILAYTEGELSTSRDIWLTDASSPDDRTNLTLGRVYTPQFLAWSPDGSRLAFSGFALGPDGMLEGGAHAAGAELFMLDIESGALTRLTHHAAEDEAPAWTPDGNGLLFTSNRDGDMDFWRLELDAPDDAWNLIDDADDPGEDSYGQWFLGAR